MQQYRLVAIHTTAAARFVANKVKNVDSGQLLACPLTAKLLSPCRLSVCAEQTAGMRWLIAVPVQLTADCFHMVQLMPLHPKTPSSLASFKSRLVLPFWYRFIQVVLYKRSLNGCSIIIIIIIKDIYIAHVRKGHKCAMSAEMAVWLRNCLYLYSYLSHN